MQVKDFHGKSVIDSREVAAMVEKQHKNLLADIRGYLKIMEKSTELKIQPSDFFVESTYQDSTGRELPRYLITKKGCDMIANKLTGEKGVLFTAAYVSAFEEMRQALDASHRSPEVSPAGLARLIAITRRVMLDMNSAPAEIGLMVRDVFRAYNFPVPASLIRQVDGQVSFFDPPMLQQ